MLLRVSAIAVLGLVSLACAEVGSSWADAGEPDTIDPPAETTGTATTQGETSGGETSTTDAPDVESPPDPGNTTGGDPGEVPDEGEPDGGEDAVDSGPSTGDDTTGEVEDGDDSGADPDVEEPPACDDGNPCTADALNDEGQCEFIYQYGVCCTANPHCNDGDDCTDDLCVSFFCEHVPSCCAVDQDCDDGETLCTEDSCQGGHCKHAPTGAEACCTPGQEVIELNFDGGTADPMVIQNGSQLVGWQVAENTDSPTPSSALYYGNPATGDYKTASTNSGFATLPPVLLPGGNVEVTFTFDFFIDVETSTLYDRLEVQLYDLSEEPQQAHIVWHKGDVLAYQSWSSAEIKLTAWSGKNVRLAFSFDTVTGQQNTGAGIYIDNIRVASNTCSTVECFSGNECDDGLGVTEEFCLIDVDAPPGTAGICAYEQNSNFCVNYVDCDDGDPCTYNNCGFGGLCTYQENTSCCLANEECEDGNLCTVNDCVGAYSQYGGFCGSPIPIPGCCLSTAECNDGNPCTVDSCPTAGGQCQHVTIAGCCSKHEDCVDGDPCTEDLCVQGGCSSASLCCAQDTDCNDGDDLCTADTCVEGVCEITLDLQPGCCMSMLQASTFTGGGWSGWSVSENSSPTDGVGWQPITLPAWSIPGSMHYGTVGGTYDTGEANSGAVDSPPVALPAQAQSWLDFRVYMDTEYANGVGVALEWDRLTVSVYRTDKPDEELLLWDSADAQPQWWDEAIPGTPIGPKWTLVPFVDLTAMKGRTVRLRFRFDTVDADANGFGGPAFDDVLVTSTCAP